MVTVHSQSWVAFVVPVSTSWSARLMWDFPPPSLLFKNSPSGVVFTLPWVLVNILLVTVV